MTQCRLSLSAWPSAMSRPPQRQRVSWPVSSPLLRRAARGGCGDVEAEPERPWGPRVPAPPARSVHHRRAGTETPMDPRYESVWNGRDELVHRPYTPREPKEYCQCCWGELDDGKCEHCDQSPTIQQRRQAARRIGMCQACLARKALPGLTIYGKCRERQQAWNARRRERFVRERRCLDCTRQLPEGWGYRRCEDCIQYRRDRASEVRRSRLAAGLCRTCGEAPRAALPSGQRAVQCRRCLDRAAELKRERRVAMPRRCPPRT